MTRDPIRGLSHQRYFHVALVSPRRRDLTEWVWSTLRKDCKLSPGRHSWADSADGEIEFKTAQAPSVYASPGSREALGVGNEECEYDVFAAAAKGVMIFGTGYASLTRFIVARLVKRDLLSNARFLVPKLHELVDFCRSRQDPDLAMRFTVTGFGAFVPGVKNVKLIRLGGTDVFNSGLVEQIERWLKTRGSHEEGSTGIEDENVHSLQYQAVRVKATGSLSGATVSLSLAADGGCKMWLRKNALNLPAFASAVSTLKGVGEFDLSTEPPKWAEDSGV